MSSTPTIPVQFLLLSDTHSQTPSADSSIAPSPTNPQPNTLLHPLPTSPRISVLLHAGDLTMSGLYAENLATYSMIAAHPAELKIVIPGNHDVTLDAPFYHGPGPKGFPKHNVPEDVDKIRNLWTGPDAQASRIVYMEEGTRTFSLSNGAYFTLYASAYTPEFQNWAFAYPLSEDRFNPSSSSSSSSSSSPALAPNPVPSSADILLTHGPPHGIFDFVPSPPSNSHVGCPHLLRALHRTRPLLHVFGHIHEGYGIGILHHQSPSLSSPTSSSAAAAPQLKTLSSTSDAEIMRHGQAGEWNVDAKGLKRGEETLVVNAAMVDVRYRGVNRAWVVEVELPVSSEEDRG